MNFLLRPNPTQPEAARGRHVRVPPAGSPFQERGEDRDPPTERFLPSIASCPPAPRSVAQKLYTLWMALVLLAIVAAGFALSYLVYTHLGGCAPDPVEAIGELWDGSH